VKTTLVLGLLALIPVLGQLPKGSTSARADEKPAAERTVVVSLQRVATESMEGRAANQRLQALAQKMAAELAAKQKELPQPNGPEFQRLAQQSQADFANTQRQAQAELRAKVAPIVNELAGQRGADVVLNADTIVWAAARLDVTNDVIARLDALPSSSKGK
jgi:Skp family chaperone for outer membrane proteins